ncbi:hypothetical protein BU23DRAFT_424677, partial [Bimuria novae-zelandiae CBS 107.79]
MKPTQSLQKTLRRLPLSTKQAGKEYYKGNRVGNLGTIDKYGRFHPDYSKIRTFVYPQKGIRNFELTPFVSSRTPKNLQRRVDEWETVPKAITGEAYLEEWKNRGGSDYADTSFRQEPVQEQSNMPEVYEEPAKK